MQDTFAVRQNFVKSTAPKPKDIIAEWPALFQYVEVLFREGFYLNVDFITVTSLVMEASLQ